MSSMSSDRTVDLAVVGFGMAGACAALQALQSLESNKQKQPEILLLDRFEGGGATSRSGGIVYFGGGTDVQRKLDVQDTVDNMYAYLQMESQGAVKDETLRAFCETSAECARWLRDSFDVQINVPDDTAVLCPFKTSNAPDKYSLFYSGSETAHPFTAKATACPRGHKAMQHHGLGGNMVGTGNVLFADMERTVLASRARGLEVLTRTKVVELIMNKNGEGVEGVVVSSLLNAPFWVRALHYSLARLGGLTNPLNYADDWILARLAQLELAYGTRSRILARRGVILACGGFGRNQALVKQHIPAYAGIMPIGSISDDGHGIFQLGMQQAGAKAGKLGNASAWKFIVPAGSMAKGVLVNARGERMANEEQYGARLAEASMIHNEGKGFLVIDQRIADECRSELWDGEMLAFQKAFTVMNLDWNRTKADTLQELAERIGCGPELLRTMQEYNADCQAGVDRQRGKRPHLLSALTQGPFYAIHFDARGTIWPTPYFSLGGLEVCEQSGAVISQDTGKPIPGLFAAGRNAVGVCSNSYVSGLSLADCLFSGRRAGEFAVSGRTFYAKL